MRIGLGPRLRFTVTVYALLVHVGGGFVAASDGEVRSLLEFKKGIKNDPLGKVQDSWDLLSMTDRNACPAAWHGVTCDDSGSVVAILLDRLGLAGDLKFFTLSGLKMLQNLSLAGNYFTGRLVPAIGSMTSLQHLDLSSNRFYGPIPVKFTQLWNLNYLNLSSNDFQGGFPTGMGNLQQLKLLDLHSNRLWGDVGDILSEIRSAEVIDLSYNLFSGSVAVDPWVISGIASTVRHLNLRRNNLSGEFFKGDSFAQFRDLELLDLGYNQVGGELPSFKTLQNLRVLRLGSNQFGGSIPVELFECLMPLEELDLSDNQFTGSIQQINCTTLNVLNLSSNGLSGLLPSSLGGSVIVDLSRNALTGDISIMQTWESKLENLDLSSNNLSGNLPNLTSQFPNLSYLKIRNNSLMGNLPPAIGTCPRLSEVDLSINNLDGPIPHSFFTSLTLKSLNLSGNHFAGKVSFDGSHTSELLVLSSYPPLESLDLSANNLTGILPSDIGKMGGLALLKLAKNSLSGQIPTEMSKLNSLKYLDFSNNNFSGKIPDKLPSSLIVFNVSYNELSGPIPENLKRFPFSSFHPGNSKLIIENGSPTNYDAFATVNGNVKHHSSAATIKVAIIFASMGVLVMIVSVLFLAYHRSYVQEFPGSSRFCGHTSGRDIKLGRFTQPSLFKFHANVEPPQSSMSFSNDHLLVSKSRSLSRKFVGEIVENVTPESAAAGSVWINPNVAENQPITSGRKSSPGSPLSSSSQYAEQSVMLDVYSPDRLAGQLFFLDASLAFTAEQLSRAPAEVLGRSSHGTLYRATLESGHMLTVKWFRVGLVKNKKEFSKECRRIGSMRHSNIVPLRAYYWGPREQERLILADYINGDSLALYLYESTPQRYSPLSFIQRLKVALDITLGLLYLHDRGLPHGNLKTTNVLLGGPELSARLTDFGLHRLMTPAGIAEQTLNLGALGYRAPELAAVGKPVPSFKADVYSLGVILMELLTRRSAGDIISGQSGAVDLPDWVQLCEGGGRGRDCIDRDLASGEEPLQAMDDLLAISVRCVLPANERPNIRQVFEDLRSISI